MNSVIQTLRQSVATGMSDISERLGISPGDHILLLNAPGGYLEALVPVPEDVTVTRDPNHAPFDIVQVFVRNSDTVGSRIAEAVEAASASRCLWVTLSHPVSETVTTRDFTNDPANLWRNGWTESVALSLTDYWHGIAFTPG